MSEQEEFQKVRLSIQELFSEKTIEASIQHFLNQQKKPYLYFKWLPHLYAYKLVKSKPFVEKEVVRLFESDPEFKLQHLEHPAQIKSLQKVVQKVAGDREMFTYTTKNDNQPSSLFFLNEQSKNTQHFVDCLNMHCERISWKDKNNFLSASQQFVRNLFNEISRSRALKLPVSALVIRCLSYEDMSQQDELQKMNLFFKSLSTHLSKNLKLYDHLSQISPDELGVILPHTSIQESTKEAQKISWMLSSINYQEMFSSKRPFKFQVGVSEYPTISRDAEDLLKKARQSSTYVEEEFPAGGVCVATAIKGFRPDFEIKTTKPS